jgi:homoserine kinase type II
LYTTLSDIDFLSALSKQWGKAFARLRPDIPLAGSPERTLWRNVVETAGRELFVLEKIPSKKYERKRQICQTLQWLSSHGLRQIAPYVIDVKGDFIPWIDHGLWQLCPFVKGVALKRPVYTLDSWRGVQAALFLMELNKTCSRQDVDPSSPPFSIVSYSRNLFSRIERRNPELANQYVRFMHHLEKNFFSVHDQLPVRICHGDFHPLNIIWGKKSIRAVIDWEFYGPKPELYDLANILGCLGMETPKSLWGPFVNQLVNELKKSNLFSIESWEELPDLTLAIRFAWLNEWLRKDDQPMIRLEADYMELLLSQRASLPIFTLHN